MLTSPAITQAHDHQQRLRTTAQQRRWGVLKFMAHFIASRQLEMPEHRVYSGGLFVSNCKNTAQTCEQVTAVKLNFRVDCFTRIGALDIIQPSRW